jgi:AraC family transcriptional regulator
MKPDTRTFYEQAVQRAIEHIVRSLDEALDLETLAREACLSPFHFHRVFQGMVGETPMEFIRRLRMERAASRLADRHHAAVTEIAFDAGYETHEAFTRAFRAYYATSPSAFAERKHRRIELTAPCGVHFLADGVIRAFVPRDSGGKTMNVDVKEVPDLRVAAVRHTGPYNQIPLAFERLNRIVEPAGLVTANTALLAIFHDDPETTAPDQLRSEAGITVPLDARLPAELVEERIPAGKYACTVHVGPYEKLGDTWARFMGEWLPASGHRVGPGASFEIYRNTPMTVPKEKLVTELYVPIA